MSREREWITNIKSKLSEAGMSLIYDKYHLFSPKSKVTHILTKFFTSKFHLDMKCNLARAGSKLKDLYYQEGPSSYLSEVQNINHKVAFSKLRLSSHDLMIERGRYRGVAREDRKCPFPSCTGIEDARHLLLDCVEYNQLREKLYVQMTKCLPQFEHICDPDKYYLMLNCHPNRSRIVAKYICQAFSKRDECIAILI